MSKIPAGERTILECLMTAFDDGDSFLSLQVARAYVSRVGMHEQPKKMAVTLSC